MEKKNVIYWVGVKNNLYSEKYGNFEYFEYSKRTWKHFCDRYNCEFVEFSEHCWGMGYPTIYNCCYLLPDGTSSANNNWSTDPLIPDCIP